MQIPLLRRSAGGGDKVGDTETTLQLTRKNLALLNSLHGDTNNDYDNDNDSAYLFESDSDTMKKLSTTTSGFEQQPYENGILDPSASKPPPDLYTIQQQLARRRSSAQPSEKAHQRYHRDISRSFNESTGSYLIQSNIMKNTNSLHYGRMSGRAITQIPKQDFNKELSHPVPDILEGLYTETLPNHLQGHGLYRNTDSLAFSHFAAEFKRRDGNFHQAVYQAAYDGATLVNARNRSLAQATVPQHIVDKATQETAVFTCATDGQCAEVFAHHFQDGEYHQNLVARQSLLSYPNRGRELIRNTQDYARSKSYELAALLGAHLEEEDEE
ncbi:hypothetical protein B0T21DRAFT_298050 [Apiosordaria backusii]|uniref:DUF7924 domain-containing protein n=1 Tax=Apiosordaria backusii TaxID=314023 RepID=A0AA40A7E1_9PEZI|nr:hypothetical protein B0T21DRAFT_298050 [Apiosordaria backusii]